MSQKTKLTYKGKLSMIINPLGMKCERGVPFEVPVGTEQYFPAAEYTGGTQQLEVIDAKPNTDRGMPQDKPKAKPSKRKDGDS